MSVNFDYRCKYLLQGNSNSFATVDLSAAYIGLSGGQGIFNYLAAGALGAFATYVGPILWTCMCVADIVRSGSIGKFVLLLLGNSLMFKVLKHVHCAYLDK